MSIKISEIESQFKTIFQDDEGKVKSVDTVYEKSDDGEFYKLVISIHGLTVEDTLIIHTKFIFKTDIDKINIIDNSFIYLYDINCIYHKVEFESLEDMSMKINNIIDSNDFGEDIQILSDFIEAPAMFLNYYLKRNKITDYSVYDVIYDPKFKTTPCDKVTFDFSININDNYDIDLALSKNNKSDDSENDKYIFKFKFLDQYYTKESTSIKNIQNIIGGAIADILEKTFK